MRKHRKQDSVKSRQGKKGSTEISSEYACHRLSDAVRRDAFYEFRPLSLTDPLEYASKKGDDVRRLTVIWDPIPGVVTSSVPSGSINWRHRCRGGDERGGRASRRVGQTSGCSAWRSLEDRVTPSPSLPHSLARLGVSLGSWSVWAASRHRSRCKPYGSIGYHRF